MPAQIALNGFQAAGSAKHQDKASDHADERRAESRHDGHLGISLFRPHSHQISVKGETPRLQKRAGEAANPLHCSIADARSQNGQRRFATRELIGDNGRIQLVELLARRHAQAADLAGRLQIIQPQTFELPQKRVDLEARLLVRGEIGSLTGEKVATLPGFSVVQYEKQLPHQRS